MGGKVGNQGVIIGRFRRLILVIDNARRLELTFDTKLGKRVLYRLG